MGQVSGLPTLPRIPTLLDILTPVPKVPTPPPTQKGPGTRDAYPMNRHTSVKPLPQIPRWAVKILFEPVSSCVKDQDVTTQPARHVCNRQDP